MRKIVLNFRSATMLTALTALSACSGGSGSSDPTITITTPAEGATVSFDVDHPDVDVAFTTTDITLRDPGMCAGASVCGHVEVFIDDTACNDQSDPANPKPYNEATSTSPLTAGLDYCPNFPDVTGTHTLKLELHKDDLSRLLDSNGQPISAQISFIAGLCGSSAAPIQVGPAHSFSPAACTVNAGDIVNWQWEDASHSVTSDTGAPATFDSGVQSTGTFQFTIPSGLAAGTAIPYHCTLHATVASGVCSGMCATLTVGQ
jgi:plastocyanin